MLGEHHPEEHPDEHTAEDATESNQRNCQWVHDSPLFLDKGYIYVIGLYVSRLTH
jgi:hypothetical protein